MLCLLMTLLTVAKYICVIDKACLVKMARYWPSSCLPFLCPEVFMSRSRGP